MARLRWRKNLDGTVASLFKGGLYQGITGGVYALSTGTYVSVVIKGSAVHRKSFTKKTTLKSGQRYVVNWLRKHGYLNGGVTRGTPKA